MHAQNYKIIAATIAQIPDHKVRIYVAELFCASLLADNPRFNRFLFLEACGALTT
jgi:hypothetical protein